MGGKMVALKYADLLDPQEGDKVTEDSIHRKLAGLFHYFLERRFAGHDDVAVWGDFKLRFGEKGKGPGPDVCVIKGVRDPKRRRGSFWVGREPGEPILVIEIVSREYKKKDYKDAKRIYEREGVPELILIEPLGEYLDGPYQLSCFRLDTSGKYRELARDTDGGIASERAGLRIVPDPNGWGLAVLGLRTGERLLTPEEEVHRAEEASRRAEEEAARCEALEKKLAELEQKLRRKSSSS